MLPGHLWKNLEGNRAKTIVENILLLNLDTEDKAGRYMLLDRIEFRNNKVKMLQVCFKIYGVQREEQKLCNII